MTDIDMTLPLARSSPGHLSRRDLVTEAGDDLVLHLAVITEDSAAPGAFDLSPAGTTVQMLLWYEPVHWDYGRPNLWAGNTLRTVDGIITLPAADGHATVLLPRGYGDYWLPRRLGYSLRLNLGGTTRTTLCWGKLHLAHGGG